MLPCAASRVLKKVLPCADMQDPLSDKLLGGSASCGTATQAAAAHGTQHGLLPTPGHAVVDGLACTGFVEMEAEAVIKSEHALVGPQPTLDGGAGLSLGPVLPRCSSETKVAAPANVCSAVCDEQAHALVLDSVLGDGSQACTTCVTDAPDHGELQCTMPACPTASTPSRKRPAGLVDDSVNPPSPQKARLAVTATLVLAAGTGTSAAIPTSVTASTTNAITTAPAVVAATPTVITTNGPIAATPSAAGPVTVSTASAVLAAAVTTASSTAIATTPTMLTATPHVVASPAVDCPTAAMNSAAAATTVATRVDDAHSRDAKQRSLMCSLGIEANILLTQLELLLQPALLQGVHPAVQPALSSRPQATPQGEGCAHAAAPRPNDHTTTPAAFAKDPIQGNGDRDGNGDGDGDAGGDGDVAESGDGDGDGDGGGGGGGGGDGDGDEDGDGTELSVRQMAVESRAEKTDQSAPSAVALSATLSADFLSGAASADPVSAGAAIARTAPTGVTSVDPAADPAADPAEEHVPINHQHGLELLRQINGWRKRFERVITPPSPTLPARPPPSSPMLPLAIPHRPSTT